VRHIRQIVRDCIQRARHGVADEDVVAPREVDVDLGADIERRSELPEDAVGLAKKQPRNLDVYDTWRVACVALDVDRTGFDGDDFQEVLVEFKQRDGCV
jgi:hypothetical protein